MPMRLKAKLEQTFPSKARYEYPPDGIINYSQLAEFTGKCRYRWDLSRNRHIVSRLGQMPLDTGSACHFGLAAGIRAFSRQKKYNHAPICNAADKAIKHWLAETVKSRGGLDSLTAEEKEDWKDIDSTFEVTRLALKNLRLERFRVAYFKGEPLVERSFQIALPKDTGWTAFHFTPDLVVEDLEYEGMWICDAKFRKQFLPIEAEEVNLQFPAYQHGLAQHGIQTLGSIMYQIRAKAPALPKLNNDGSMSRSRISTTWETYKAALIKNGLNPHDYLEMQTKLDVEFFREQREPRDEAMVGWIWNDMFLPAARTMAREMGQPFRTGMFNGHMQCGSCWARNFCVAELRGDDTDFLLKTDYINLKAPQPRVILKPEDIDYGERE